MVGLVVADLGRAGQVLGAARTGHDQDLQEILQGMAVHARALPALAEAANHYTGADWDCPVPGHSRLGQQ